MKEHRTCTVILLISVPLHKLLPSVHFFTKLRPTSHSVCVLLKGALPTSYLDLSLNVLLTFQQEVVFESTP